MTENLAKPVSYQGGCHCGAVRFRVQLEKKPGQAKYEAISCNCSICTKKGFLHLIVPAENFTLLKGENSLTTYQFNTGTAKLETGFLQTILVKRQKQRITRFLDVRHSFLLSSAIAQKRIFSQSPLLR
jgi:hypothetical protein